MVLRRFKEPSDVAMQTLVTQKYTLRDAANQRQPR